MSLILDNLQAIWFIVVLILLRDECFFLANVSILRRNRNLRCGSGRRPDFTCGSETNFQAAAKPYGDTLSKQISAIACESSQWER